MQIAFRQRSIFAMQLLSLDLLWNADIEVQTQLAKLSPNCRTQCLRSEDRVCVTKACRLLGGPC